MTDEEYIFRQTERERKRDGRGAFNRVCGSKSKKCSLPSDHMTRKEIIAMSGEVQTYTLNEAHLWTEIENWPDEIRAQYFKKLFIEMNATGYEIADMLECSFKKVRGQLTKFNLTKGRGNWQTAEQKENWQRFITGLPLKYPEKPQNATLKVDKGNDTPEEEVREKAPQIASEDKAVEKVAAETSNTDNIAALIAALRGTGAKLTIEVTI